MLNCDYFSFDCHLKKTYLKSNKGDLHGEDGAQAVNCAVCHIDPMREAAGEHEHQHVKGNEVNQKHVSTPR